MPLFHQPLGNHTIVHRPGLYTFLDATVQSYELVVFTAGTKEYADSVLNSIDPEGKYFNRRFYRSSCKFRDGVYCKDLRSVGSDLSRTIIIDNIPENYAMQPENGVPIVDFIGDEYDSALIDLLPLLTGKRHSPPCSLHRHCARRIVDDGLLTPPLRRLLLFDNVSPAPRFRQPQVLGGCAEFSSGTDAHVRRSFTMRLLLNTVDRTEPCHNKHTHAISCKKQQSVVTRS